MSGCGLKYCGRCGREMSPKLRERYLRWRMRRNAIAFAKHIDALLMREVYAEVYNRTSSPS